MTDVDKKFSGENVAKNSFWSVLERVCAQIVSFVISVILARLLMPSDYGIVALVQVFINICSLLVDRGLASALSQKKNPDKEDYYTVLNFGFFLSLFLYAILYFFAPYIGQFYSKYNTSLLISVIRLMGLALPISTIRIIIVTYIGKNMMFKKFFWATLIGTVISGIVGIILAYNGAGVYALVAQHLINLTIDTILLAVIIKKPWLSIMSIEKLKKLISYGWKVMLSSALTTIVNSVRSTTVASTYEASDLAYYDKGESLPKIVIGNIDVAIANVLFPTMSNAQDDVIKLKNIVREFVKLSSYIIFPMLFGLFAVSDILIPTLFGSQWIPAIPYLKIFALIYLFYPIQDAALLSIRSLGKSGKALIIDIIGKSIIVASLFTLLKFGPIYLTIGFLLSTIIVVIINGIAMRKYIGYRLHEQIFDFGVNLLPSIIMLISVYFLHFIPINNVALLIIQIIVGIVVYFVFSALTKNKQFIYFKNLISGFLKKFNFKKISLSWSSISISRPILMSLAIIWIMLYHAGIPAPDNVFLRVLWYIFIDFGGGLGVNIFLILSGFGLMFSHKKNNCYASLKQLIKFYWKRFSRIFISYTIIFVVYYLIKYGQFNGSFIDFLAKYTIYEFIKTGFKEFWYIHAIAILYLIFPLFAFLYDKINTHVSFIISIVAFISIEFIFYYFLPSTYNSIEILLTRTPCFAIGCYLGYFAINKKQVPFVLYLCSCLGAVILLITSFILIKYGNTGLGLNRYLFVLLSAFLVIVLSPIIAKISHKLKILKWYGQFTLQLYLTHILLFVIFKEILNWNFNNLLMFLLVFFLSSLISIGLFYSEKVIWKIKRK